MSDPVKSSEIEDVLSSIRRLVSEDTRAISEARPSEGTAPTDAGAEEADEPFAADALVLTPALRIHDGGLSDEGATESVASETPEMSEGAKAELRDVVLEAVADAVQEELVEDLPLDLGDTIREETLNNADTSQEQANPDLSGSAAEALEAKINALETLIGEKPVDSPQEGFGENGEQADIAVEPEPEPIDWEDHSPDVLELAEAEPNEVEENPEAVETSDSEAEGENQIREAEADTQEAPVARLDGARDSTEIPLTYEEPEMATIDEGALREMVSEIVRQELQGALGERITRNVRRLVRREIHRALASQELD